MGRSEAPTQGTSNPRDAPRWAWLIPAILAAAVAGAATAWALMTALRPADDPLDTAAYTLVEVEAGVVRSSISLGAVAEWNSMPVGVNQASGIVTGVSVSDGAEVSPGATLYSVDLRPVIIARGEVPAFRDITSGASGADVSQLQDMLRDTGFYDGATDGTVRWSTTSAIRAWQRSLGVEVTGTVGIGDVIFVPTLPARVVLDRETVSRGAALSGGEPTVNAIGESPVFTLPVTDAQASSIPAGTLVEISTTEGSIWRAVSGAQHRDEQAGATSVRLEQEGQQAICEPHCDQIPVSGKTSFRAEVVTVPTVEGLVVPSSALVTTAGSELALIDAEGELSPVTVRASARGVSVVEGVSKGTRVRVPGELR